MPRPDSVHPSNKEPSGEVHQDVRGPMAPWVQVWNTFINVTGSSMVVPPNVNTLLVSARPERRLLTVIIDQPTGTATNVYFGLGHPAGLQSGLGPLTGHGSQVTMDGSTGIYPGTVSVIHDGVGNVRLNIHEAW